MKAVLEMPGERVERLGTRGIAVHANDRQCPGPAPFEIMEAEAVGREAAAGGLCGHGHRAVLSFDLPDLAKERAART